MKTRTRTLWLLLLPVQWLVYKGLSFFPTQVEQYYSQGLYPPLSRALRIALGWLPFPVGQLLFYAALAYLLFSLFKLLKQLKKPTKERWSILGNSLLTAGSYLSIIYLVFNVLWGINYSRQPLKQSLELPTSKYDVQVLENLCKELIEQSNAHRAQLEATSGSWGSFEGHNTALFAAAVRSYNAAEKRYPLLAYKTPSVKAVVLPQIMSYAGIGGIYFPFTAEANVNADPPVFKLPFTTCHEMAHQLGFASETEANFIAYVVCRSSDEPLFQYSGSYTAMRYAMSALYRSDTAAYRSLTQLYTEEVKEDLAINRAYWKQFESPLGALSDTVNDAFLKANGQKEGIKSYGKMVDLLLADFAKRTSLLP